MTVEAPQPDHATVTTFDAAASMYVAVTEPAVTRVAHDGVSVSGVGVASVALADALPTVTSHEPVALTVPPTTAPPGVHVTCGA